MIISLIAAMSQERVIGRAGKLPWHIPADLARFKSITMGHAVLMGRKTFESIGHPLPGRRTIVLTRTGGKMEGCEIAGSLPQAISAAEGNEEIFICGGELVFREALPLCHRIYLTVVHASYQGDVHFPELPASFLELHREERPDLTPALTFLVYERVDRIEPGADVHELIEKGREATQRQLYYLARRCFEQALTTEDSAETRSELAFSIAKSGGDCQAALHLAEKALQDDPENVHLHLQVGRVQILAGDKEKGLQTLRKGLQLGGGPEFLAELQKFGTRTPPPLRSLPRSHPLNRYLGLMLHRMGMRGTK